MKAYISGPMSGIKDYNKPAFKQVESILRANGYKTANPASIEMPKIVGFTDKQIWVWCMKKALRMMLKCDTIVLLPGWTKSKGAKVERWIGMILEYRIEEFDKMDLVF